MAASSSASGFNSSTLSSMARTEHKEPGLASRLRDVLSPGSAVGDENFKDTCKSTGTLSSQHKNFKGTLSSEMRIHVGFSDLVWQTFFNGEIHTVCYSFSIGKNCVNHHLSVWSQSCRLLQCESQFSCVFFYENKMCFCSETKKRMLKHNTHRKDTLRQ